MDPDHESGTSPDDHGRGALRAGSLLLNRYRVDGVIEGGMGVLCLVTCQDTGERYAVKTLPAARRADAKYARRFLREARTWIDLGRHPGLVEALWFTESDHGPLLFLEYVDGQTLTRALEGGPLSVEQSVDLALQAAAAMAHAHEKAVRDGVGVLHRDLKPDNLLVTPDGRLKVTDFGLARVHRSRDETEISSESTPLGTLEYMAPEQVRGETVDRRGDLYSFGLVLHEMLSGANPLRGSNVSEQLHKILEVEPPALESVPDALRTLVARLVSKAPAERPEDFREVLSALAFVARGLEHDWHVDPASIATSAAPSVLSASVPFFRPRRPRAGEPFSVGIELTGDLGAGPVEVTWAPRPGAGVEVLTPGGRARVRSEVGGRTPVVLRVQLVAEQDGVVRMPAGRVEVRGAGGRAGCAVAPFELEVTFAFHPPLCGRERECAQLRAHLEAVQRGEPGLLVWTGDLGAGKSRLLLEAARLAAGVGARTGAGRGEAGGHRPMRVLNDAARSLLGVPTGRTSRGTVPQRIAEALDDVLGEDPATARYFRELLRGGHVDEEVPALRWFRFLSALAREGPVCLLLDDLQWSGKAARAIVIETSRLLREARAPVLIVASVRTGAGVGGRRARKQVEVFLDALRRHAGQDPRVTVHALAPLTPAELGALLEARFPGNAFSEEAPWFLQAVAEQTQGNPYHVTEILRVLLTGDPPGILRAEGHWQLARHITPQSLRRWVPAALDGVLRRRFEALGPQAQEVVGVAALIGDEFDVELLRQVVQEARTVEQGLAELEAADLIRPAGVGLDRYRFSGATFPAAVQRVVAKRSPERTRHMHQLLAEGMLRLYHGEAMSRQALAAAEHLRKSGADDRSLEFTLLGCARLLSLRSFERARRLLQGAQGLAERADVPADTRARFHYLYGRACEASGDYETGLRALRAYAEAAAGGETVGGKRSLARAYMAMGRIHQARGEHDSARSAYGFVREALEEVGDKDTLAFAYNALAGLALERGELERASDCLVRARLLAEQTRNRAAAAQAVTLHGALSLARGDLAAAARAFALAERSALELGDRRRRGPALEGLAEVDLDGGYLERAERRAREAVELYGVMGDRRGMARSRLLRGRVQQARGRAHRALRDFRRAQRLSEEIGNPEGVAHARHYAGRVLRARCKTDLAVADLAAAFEGLNRLHAPERFAALRDLAQALVDSGNPAVARTALARADRGEPPGAQRKIHRTHSRAQRAHLHLRCGNLRCAAVWARRAVSHAARLSGHGPRVAAHLALAEVALRQGAVDTARRAAETVLAFAPEQRDPLDRAAAERILAEIAALEGRREEARRRSHRAARAYTGRPDAGEGPAQLLWALGSGLRHADPAASRRYLRAAGGCYARLEAQGLRRPRVSSWSAAAAPRGT